MKNARIAFAFLAWTFVGLVAVQVFLAGVGLFGAAPMTLHREFGYWLPLVALAVLLAGAVARGGSLVWLSAGLLLLTVVQGVLPALRADLPIVAALHPVNALLLAGLGLVIARRATAYARLAEPAPMTVAPEGSDVATAPGA